MNILDKIVACKQRKVAARKASHPIETLMQSAYFDRPVVSLKEQLLTPGNSGIIAEFKRRSPSNGFFSKKASIVSVSKGYVAAGAAALSVLTDTEFFGGNNDDLLLARANNQCPILRKDFIIDEYQILEARAIGADAILLIAAVLTEKKLLKLASFAAGLGLEVIMEVHNKEELKGLNSNIDIIGVNNRDLKTFTTDIYQSLSLLPHIPSGFVKISESGISKPSAAVQLKKAGYNGFLIGEQFMKQIRPEEACAQFITEYKNMVYEN